LLHEQWPNTPFILVSGSIGEEAAANIMKLGASDYLLKDRLARLVPAVEQALTKRAIQLSELRVKAALELSERQLREAQRVAKLGSWVWEPGTGHAWWSDALFELFGVDRASVAASFEAFLELVHSDDRPIALRRVEGVLAGADGFADDLRIVTSDGRLLWIHSQAQASRDATGQLIRMEGTDQDITERKRAEIALVEREAVYRLLADQMRDVVVLADADGAIRYISPSCEHLSGYTPVESQLLGLWYIVLPDDLPVVRAAWARCLKDEVVTFEWVPSPRWPPAMDGNVVNPRSGNLWISRSSDLDETGRHRPARCRRAASTVAEDGGHRTVGRWGGARLQ
jgi:PAS domain S-box-containing protein